VGRQRHTCTGAEPHADRIVGEAPQAQRGGRIWTTMLVAEPRVWRSLVANPRHPAITRRRRADCIPKTVTLTFSLVGPGGRDRGVSCRTRVAAVGPTGKARDLVCSRWFEGHNVVYRFSDRPRRWLGWL